MLSYTDWILLLPLYYLIPLSYLLFHESKYSFVTNWWWGGGGRGGWGGVGGGVGRIKCSIGGGVYQDSLEWEG